VATLEAYREQIATWLEHDHLPLTRAQELLDQPGVPVTYMAEFLAMCAGRPDW
jgi:hypothetical protein